MGEFMHTVTYEMHGLGCIELILILSVGFVGNLWINGIGGPRKKCIKLYDIKQAVAERQSSILITMFCFCVFCLVFV